MQLLINNRILLFKLDKYVDIIMQIDMYLFIIYYYANKKKWFVDLNFQANNILFTIYYFTHDICIKKYWHKERYVSI